MSETAKIIVGGKEYILPVITGSENEKAIDIGKFRAESGVITLDYGFKNTGSTTSGITFLDGEKGILKYRGYGIEELAEKSNFLEVAYLLIYGDLPTTDQLHKFNEDIALHSFIHEDTKQILNGFPSSSHPMGVLSSIVTSQTAFYPDSLDPNRSPEGVDLMISRMLAKMPTFARGLGFQYTHLGSGQAYLQSLEPVP